MEIFIGAPNKNGDGIIQLVALHATNLLRVWIAMLHLEPPLPGFAEEREQNLKDFRRCPCSKFVGKAQDLFLTFSTPPTGIPFRAAHRTLARYGMPLPEKANT